MPDSLNGWIRLEIYLFTILSPLFESCSTVCIRGRRLPRSWSFPSQHLVFQQLIQSQEPIRSFFELSEYIGTMSSKWLCFRGQDGGGPVVLAGKQLSTVYWAMNLLAINRLLQYSTILCCYLTRLGCTRIDFVWFWDFVPRSTLSNIWSVQCPRCVNKICQ